MTATPALVMSVLAESEAEAVIRLERAGARDAATARQVSRDDADLLAAWKDMNTKTTAAERQEAFARMQKAVLAKPIRSTCAAGATR